MADGARFCIRQRRGWPAAIGRKGTRMAVSLDKVQRQAPGLLPLAKKADDKVREYGLDGERAKFALVLDYSSGPMRRKYDNDSMQRLAEKVIALATRFNDDGVIDVFLFGSKAWHAGPLGIDDYENGINRLIGGKAMGGTDYDYAFDKVLDYYGSDTASTRTIEKKGLLGRTRIVKARGGPDHSSPPAGLPVYAVRLTDGSPDLDRLPPDQLYGMLLDEYKDWLAIERREGLLR